MNILLWYLPFAIFTGACDLTVSEGEVQTRRECTTEAPEESTRLKITDRPR